MPRSSAPDDLLADLPKLGVGLAYQPALRPFIAAYRDDFDYLEVVPDILWTDLGRTAASAPGGRYVDDLEGQEFLRLHAAGRPVVPHSIGLSIGTAHRFNRDHLEPMGRWLERFPAPWYSDHLAFNLAEHGADELNAGVTIPLPRDRETLESLAPRVAEVVARLGVPFLLENNVYFFDMPDAEYDDAGFLNALCRETGCGLLLDLHNVHCNAVNHGTDPYRLLGELDLDRVVELHVAGGMEYEGYYLDAHCGPMPEEVRAMLDWVLPRCPRVGGVTFELLGSWYPEMGAERLRRELTTMREAWAHHQPAPAPAWDSAAPGRTAAGPTVPETTVPEAGSAAPPRVAGRPHGVPA